MQGQGISLPFFCALSLCDAALDSPGSQPDARPPPGDGEDGKPGRAGPSLQVKTGTATLCTDVVPGTGRCPPCAPTMTGRDGCRRAKRHGPGPVSRQHGLGRSPCRTLGTGTGRPAPSADADKELRPDANGPAAGSCPPRQPVRWQPGGGLSVAVLPAAAVLHRPTLRQRILQRTIFHDPSCGIRPAGCRPCAHVMAASPRPARQAALRPRPRRRIVVCPAPWTGHVHP